MFSVASQVLSQDKLELDGYLLKVKEKQPEIFLPLDKKKLYVENLNPNTSKDSLENYIELTSKLEVRDVQFGENRNALVTFSEEPGISMQIYRELLEMPVMTIPIEVSLQFLYAGSKHFHISLGPVYGFVHMRLIPEPTARSAVPGVSPGRGLLISY